MRTISFEKILLIAALFCLFIVNTASADWPVGRRKFILYTSYTVFNAKNSWDSTGRYKTSSYRFSSQSLALAGSYGLSRWWDLKFNLPFYQTDNQGATATNFGYGDVTMGFNRALVNFNYANFISLYVGGVFPIYADIYSKQKALNYNALEVKLSNSGSISKLFGYKTVGYGVNDYSDPSSPFGNAYYSIEAGYRYYLQTTGDREYTYDASLGFSLDKKNQLSIDISGVNAFNYYPYFSRAEKLQHQFSYAKASLSYGHKFSRRISAYITGFYTFTGTNSAQGYGLSYQLIARL